MALFDIPQRSTRKQDIANAKRSKTQAKPVKVARNSVLDTINAITSAVEKNLGQYRDKHIVIQDKDVLHDYMTECIGNSYISIDTETDGLDPMLNKLVGICVYTPNQLGAYIPLNHVSYVTGAKADGQLPKEFVLEEFKRLLVKRPDSDMFNAKFDIRFLRHGLGLSDIYCTWDAYLASRILNENEPHKGLKLLHQKYCRNGQGDAFSFDDLFRGITFDKVPINVGSVYAAHDAVITSEYSNYQRKHLRLDSEREDIRRMAWVFHNIEMPCVNVICDMEDNGIELDLNYSQKLSIRYHELLEQKIQAFEEALVPHSKVIDAYRAKNPNCKLDDPINIGSPTQIAILLYDVLKLDAVDSKNPRGTGEAILAKMDNPVCQAILDYREIQKLLSTYIDKLPECVNPNDGRIHCNFNQYGADTGRMSSSDPNLQNIPSHNKDIRKMFVAGDGYLLMSSDFSQQEPKCLAALCRKQGDSQMYDTFMAGKDLYSEIASKAFNKPYEECREFNPDGTTNKAGKERRTQAKSILLGVLYGRGEKSIGEQLGCSEQKAKEIKESVFRGFPAIKQFEQDSLDMAYELGYATTVCGRKRRLPDLQLPEYEFKWKDGKAPDSDPLDFDSDSVDTEIPERLKRKYLNKLKSCWGREKRNIYREAEQEGIWIVDNGGKIADATRQCVNSRIQGSAADLTKLAMIKLNENKHLKELGFRLLIPVHDEIIAECPQENAKECSQLLAETMSKAAEAILEMPIKCDVTITKEWYGEEVKLNGN